MAGKAPVDLVLVEFSGNRFDGRVLTELERLSADGTIEVLDALLVSRRADSSIEWLEAATVDKRLAALVGEPAGLLSAEDAEAVAEELQPDTAIGMLVFQHSWAATLAEAMRGVGGRLLDWERIPAAAVAELAEN
ncbi:DUF6325 family protein [Glycomyces tritici]|uniref:DUF6325 family protein n=1 Tax=Glycomyces tritici TaxID=2665176 RepID=A0ABT7YNY5_9ACTN|nr:DUF6325 family protein [Glycomyces tritici]MDN3240109.1 DUF6325 family protein [Glycomyces tritici]